MLLKVDYLNCQSDKNPAATGGKCNVHQLGNRRELCWQDVYSSVAHTSLTTKANNYCLLLWSDVGTRQVIYSENLRSIVKQGYHKLCRMKTKPNLNIPLNTQAPYSCISKNGILIVGADSGFFRERSTELESKAQNVWALKTKLSSLIIC